MNIINPEIPYFNDDGLSCSESTLRCLIENHVVDLPISAVKMMTGLHGNMGRCANCGAVNGAAAAIGAMYGRTEPEQDSKRVYRILEDFLREFEGKFGSVKCEELLANNDPASLEQQYRCSEYVLTATEIVTRLLKEEKTKDDLAAAE